MLTILKIAGIVLASLAALLLVLLLLPAKLMLLYEKSEISLRLRYAFFTLKIYDSQVKEAAEAAKEAVEEPLEEVTEKKGLDWNIIRRVLRPGAHAVRRILGQLRFSDIRVRLVAGGDEPADIGIMAGRMWAAMGAAQALIATLWPNVFYEELTVIPDFTGEYADATRISLNVAATPLALLITALVFYVRYRRALRDIAREKSELEQEKPPKADTAKV